MRYIIESISAGYTLLTNLTIFVFLNLMANILTGYLADKIILIVTNNLTSNTGAGSIYCNQKIRMINYWLKLLKLEDNAIVKQIYLMLKVDADNNISYNGSNWAFQIKSLLDELGLTYIWLQQTEIVIPINLIKQRIFYSFYQSWYAIINNSNRLLTYSRYKHEFKFENYLDFILEKKYKIALTQFRLSSHDLAIERGRYVNIPRNERTCTNCNLDMVESNITFF